MQTNIGHSIQDYLKKINSAITSYDILSLFLTVVILFGFLLYVNYVKSSRKVPVIYTTSETKAGMIVQNSSNALFGSIHGSTYTFSWCKGASKIKEKNKIFFSSEDEAKRSGRTLSKLCT